MAFIAGTPNALPATADWWHNFPPGGRPAWAWIRTAFPKVVNIEIKWGVVVVAFQHHIQEHGLLISSPSSLAVPPVRIRFLNSVGWVDFGSESIPDSIDIERFDPFQQFRVRDLGKVLNATKYKKSRSVTMFLDSNPLVNQALEWELQREGPNTLTPGKFNLTNVRVAELQPSAMHFSAEQFRALRKFRRMSQEAVVRHIESRTDGTTDAGQISIKRLRRLEEGKGMASAIEFGALLDSLLDARGMSCRLRAEVNLAPNNLNLQRVGSESPTSVKYEVRFPSFWVGPIWIHIRKMTHSRSTNSDTADATLSWGIWAAQLLVTSGVTVWSRRNLEGDPPLLIRLPVGWEVIAGIGHYDAPNSRHPIAIDINSGWIILDEANSETFYKSVVRAYELMLPLVLGRLKRSQKLFRRLEIFWDRRHSK